MRGPGPGDSLPFGIFSTASARPRVGVAVGDDVLDLAPVLEDAIFASRSLNAFMARGRSAWRAVRGRLLDLIAEPSDRVRNHLHPIADVTLHLPFEVGDYVDFYSSRHHAENVGRIFRPGADPLPPNWLHQPIGYHGRSGTIVVSGAPIIRPTGQLGPHEVGPTQRLDVESEVGFVIGVPSEVGSRVPVEAFADHVFGLVLVNDWSARDIQAWESQPLGPFLGKSFATSISPWVVPLDALTAARLPTPPQDPSPLPYLTDGTGWALDLTLELAINDHVVSRPPFSSMYWTAPQQLAHMTLNGAGIRTGDLFASGTVSGPAHDQWGSLLELTWNGRDPLMLADGSTRTWLEDGDTVTMSSPGFGCVEGTVVPRR